MKSLFHIFVFTGVLNLSGFAFAEEEKTEAKASEESIQVVCPVSTEENCSADEATAKSEQPAVENAENK